MQTPLATSSGNLTKTDLFLIISLTTIFVICLGLHIKMVFGDGVPLTTIGVEVGKTSSDPPVIVFFSTHRRGNDNLQIGDRLLSVGEVELQGLSQQQFQVAMAGQVRYGKSAVVTAERNGEIIYEKISAASGKVPWSHIPFVTGFAIIALIVILRAPDVQSSRLFFSAFMTLAIFQTSIGDGSDFQLIMAGWFFHVFGVISITLILLYVIGFPRAEVEADIRRIPRWVALVPALVWLAPRADSFFTAWLPAKDFTAYSFATDVFFLVSVVAILSWNYYCTDAANRRKLRWVLFGVYVAILPNIVMNTTGSLFPGVDIQWFHAISALCYTAIPISIWIAIAHFNLFDVDRVISGALSYTVLVVLLALLAEALLEPQAASLAMLLGLGADTGQLIFVALLAALAIPIQKIIRPTVERFFLPHHHNLNESIESLIDKISAANTASLDEISALIGISVTESLKPEFCAVYLRDENDWQASYCSGLPQAPSFTIAESVEIAAFFKRRVMPLRIDVRSKGDDNIQTLFSELQVTLVVPFLIQNECKAFLILSQKLSHDVYTKTDVSLLTAVAMQASLTHG